MPQLSAALVAAFLLSAVAAPSLATSPAPAISLFAAAPANAPERPLDTWSPVQPSMLPTSSPAAARSSMGAISLKSHVGATPVWPPVSSRTADIMRASSAPLPTSPYEAGSVVIVWQWCDTAAAMGEVADTHATQGLEAARARWDALVEAGACHWIPPALATTAVLVNRTRGVDVMIPLNGRSRPACVEIWLAAIDGVRPHGYVATLFPLPGEET